MRETKSTKLKIHHKINRNIKFMANEIEEKVVFDMNFEKIMN